MKKNFLAAVLVAAGMLLPMPSDAAWNPNQSVKMLVPFNPGGGTDQQARLVEKDFQAEFGQPLSFIYKPGADGSIGATEFKDYAPNGLSIAVHSFPLMMMNPLNNKGRYTMRDFDYIGYSNIDVAVLTTRSESNIKTLEQFIAAAKAAPADKKLTVGVVEVLGPSHIAALKLLRLGVPMNIITIQGGAKGLTAVLGGHIDALMTVKGASLNSASKLNILAVASPSADKDLSGVPTFKDKGFDLVSLGARIWIAPKGLPTEIKDRYEEGFAKIYAKEDVKARLANAGQPVSFGNGSDLLKIISDFDKEAKELVEFYKSTKK